MRHVGDMAGFCRPSPVPVYVKTAGVGRFAGARSEAVGHMRAILFSVVLSIIPVVVAGAGDHAQQRTSPKDSAHGHHWMAPPEAVKRPNPIPADTNSLTRGRKVFQENCANCHGANGRGDGRGAAPLNPRPTNLAAMAGHHSDGDYAWKIANGRGAMPAWKGILSDNQIWDVVNFIQRLGGAKPSADGHYHGHHHPGHHPGHH